MKTKDIFDFWDKGNKELLDKTKPSKEAILNYIHRNSRVTSWYFGFNMIFYCLFILGCIIMSSMNLPGYSANPVIKPVLIFQLTLSIFFLLYGIIMYIRYREINNYRISTYDLIKKRLRFYGSYHEIWMVIAALSVLILIFNLNIMVDYNDGMYPIHNKKLYVIINLAILLFIYGLQKLAAYFNLIKLKSYLIDLKSGFLNESRKIEKQKRWYKLLTLILLLIFTITFILGLLKFLK